MTNENNKAQDDIKIEPLSTEKAAELDKIVKRRWNQRMGGSKTSVVYNYTFHSANSFDNPTYTPAENMQFSLDNLAALKTEHGDFVQDFFALGHDSFQYAYLHAMPQLQIDEQEAFIPLIERNTEMNLRQNAWKYFPKQTVPLEGYSVKVHPALEGKDKRIKTELKEEFLAAQGVEYKNPFDVSIVDRHQTPMGVAGNILWNNMKIGTSINVYKENIARLAYDLGVYHAFNQWQDVASIDPSDPRQIEGKYALTEGMKQYAKLSHVQDFE